MFKTWKEAYDYQQERKLGSGDNSFHYDKPLELPAQSENISEVPFAVGHVVSLIMAEGFDLGDYEEWCTVYGMSEDGKWTAVEDSHCSCYGWEADEDNITFYDSLTELLFVDPKAEIIQTHWAELKKIYEFLKEE